jgi:RNA-directed DNA polymerase
MAHGRPGRWRTLGIPTSPLLANAVCIHLDERLRALVPGGRYTRYADDLSFSGPVLPSKSAVAAELEKEGFQLSEHKWRAARAGRGLYVTGLSLEDGRQPRVPKAMKRRLRQDLYHARERGLVAHFGARNYGSLQSGINQIEGLISYVRGIEPGIGSRYLAQWQALLADAGLGVAHASQSALAERKILFVVDESLLENGDRTVMVLALVVVEDVDVVREASQKFLESLAADPYGATEKQELNAKGLHWNAFAQDDRTRATEWARSLPFRCFMATATLADQHKATYDDTYRRLLVKLVEGRLVRYDRCTIDVLIEQNSNVNLPKLVAAVESVYEKLEKMNSRRPAAAPSIRSAAKLEEGALPLPDIVMGIFGDFARSSRNAQADAVAKKKKKRVPGAQAENRFEQVRDKIRAIYDSDSGAVFSRRNPFVPW